MEQPFTVRQLEHFVINVRDVERSMAFYRMFGGPVEEGSGRNVRVQLGPTTRLLLHHDPEHDPQSHGNLNHFALDLEGSTDMEEVLAHVRAYGAEPFDGPRDNGRGAIQFRVLDPDGNEIELHFKQPPPAEGPSTRTEEGRR